MWLLEVRWIHWWFVHSESYHQMTQWEILHFHSTLTRVWWFSQRWNALQSDWRSCRFNFLRRLLNVLHVTKEHYFDEFTNSIYVFPPSWAAEIFQLKLRTINAMGAYLFTRPPKKIISVFTYFHSMLSNVGSYFENSDQSSMLKYLCDSSLNGYLLTISNFRWTLACSALALLLSGAKGPSPSMINCEIQRNLFIINCANPPAALRHPKSEPEESRLEIRRCWVRFLA